MTDRELTERLASLGEYQRETDRQLRELKIQLGRLGQKLGGFTEGFAFPSMSKILRRRFHMDAISPGTIVERNGRTFEVDVLAWSESGIAEVYIVEVKSHLRQDGIVQIKKALREFHEFFPGHRGKKVYGILAAVSAPPQVCRKVVREGIYLARIHDDELELQVPADFQPRAF
jgi:hypothetical protein